MPTEPITVKIGLEPWVLPYVNLCIFFMKRGWECDEEAVKTKILTGITVT